MTHPMLAALHAWLYDPGSFMERTRQYGLQPQVHLLRQAWEYPQEEESERLGVRPRQYIYLREVEIRHEQQVLMFARTAIPLKVLKGEERQLQFLGTRSLGSVLFSYPHLERSPFEMLRCRLPQYSLSELWGRRSIFHLRQKPVLLTEVFLPELIERIIKRL